MSAPPAENFSSLRVIRSRSPSPPPPPPRPSAPNIPNNNVTQIQPEAMLRRRPTLTRSTGSRSILDVQAIQKINELASAEGVQLSPEDLKAAQIAASAAASTAKQEAKELVAAVESVNIKKGLIIGKKAETALTIFSEIGEKAKNVLPQILKVVSLTGGAALSATGIGLPIVIGVAITVATVMRAVNQRLEIRKLLNDHFNLLLYIIKNFAVVQQTLELLDVEYPEYDKEGNPIKQLTSNGRSIAKREITRVRLSNGFQRALVEYSTLLSAQTGGPANTPNGAVKRFFKKAARGMTQLITAGRVLGRLKELFSEIERQYFLEIAKFSTLMFFNEQGFEKIKDVILEGKRYYKLATANFDYTSPNCSQTSNPGAEDAEDAICILKPEVLHEELQKDLEMLFSLVKREDFEKATEISDLMAKGNEEITNRATTELQKQMSTIDNLAELKVNDIVQVAAATVTRAKGIETSVGQTLTQLNKEFNPKSESKSESKGGGFRRQRRHTKKNYHHRRHQKRTNKRRK
jgi:hypothetical protein